MSSADSNGDDLSLFAAPTCIVNDIFPVSFLLFYIITTETKQNILGFLTIGFRPNKYTCEREKMEKTASVKTVKREEAIVYFCDLLRLVVLKTSF